MSIARPALVALLVGLALLASSAIVLQFQEPAECANRVEPATATDAAEPTVAKFQYDDLSPAAKRPFDRARSAGGSVIVYGDQCPAAFEYTADRTRYAIVTDDSRYVLTTYANDLLPEVRIAAAALALLGAVVLGTGVATRDDPGMWFPVLIGALGLVTLAAVTAAVVLDRWLWAAVGWTGLLTALALVGAGATLPSRHALGLGGALSLLAAALTFPLVGPSVVFVGLVGLAAVPLSLVGVGVGLRKGLPVVRGRTRDGSG